MVKKVKKIMMKHTLSVRQDHIGRIELSKRKTPIQLVYGTKSVNARGVNWYQRLSDADQLYVRDVVDAAAINPDAAPRNL